MVLHGPSWEGAETLCTPEKSDIELHRRTRYDGAKLAAEWGEPLERYGDSLRASHVARASWELGAKTAEDPPGVNQHRHQELVLLDLAVEDVLRGAEGTNLPALLVGGCAELFAWSSNAADARPDDWLAKLPGKSGTFHSGILQKPGANEQRLFLSAAYDLVMGMVDQDFKNYHVGKSGDDDPAVIDSAAGPGQDGARDFSEVEGDSGGDVD